MSVDSGITEIAIATEVSGTGLVQAGCDIEIKQF